MQGQSQSEPKSVTHMYPHTSRDTETETCRYVHRSGGQGLPKALGGTDMHEHRHPHTDGWRGRPGCMIHKGHLMGCARLTFVGCLPWTRQRVGHHTHVTSLDPPTHLPTVSEASGIVIPTLQMEAETPKLLLEYYPVLPDLGALTEVQQTTDPGE